MYSTIDRTNGVVVSCHNNGKSISLIGWYYDMVYILHVSVSSIFNHFQHGLTYRLQLTIDVKNALILEAGNFSLHMIGIFILFDIYQCAIKLEIMVCIPITFMDLFLYPTGFNKYSE